MGAVEAVGKRNLRKEIFRLVYPQSRHLPACVAPQSGASRLSGADHSPHTKRLKPTSTASRPDPPPSFATASCVRSDRGDVAAGGPIATPAVVIPDHLHPPPPSFATASSVPNTAPDAAPNGTPDEPPNGTSDAAPNAAPDPDFIAAPAVQPAPSSFISLLCGVSKPVPEAARKVLPALRPDRPPHPNGLHDAGHV